MREIKFRAWSGERFYYWGFINGVFISPIYKDDAIVLENQQYTGLKDKNGKEIYEADVVKFEAWRDNANAAYYNAIDEIKFDFGQFHIHGSALRDYTNIEVIGNVYENKDLIAD
jgi:uncharacterized phage protein (TIGR01671 family)